jgi:hypothetical protein
MKPVVSSIDRKLFVMISSNLSCKKASERFNPAFDDYYLIRMFDNSHKSKPKEVLKGKYSRERCT